MNKIRELIATLKRNNQLGIAMAIAGFFLFGLISFAISSIRTSNEGNPSVIQVQKVSTLGLRDENDVFASIKAEGERDVLDVEQRHQDGKTYLIRRQDGVDPDHKIMSEEYVEGEEVISLETESDEDKEDNNASSFNFEDSTKKIIEDALKREEEARKKAEEEEARKKAEEEEARRKAEEEARRKAEEEARRKAEEERRLSRENPFQKRDERDQPKTTARNNQSALSGLSIEQKASILGNYGVTSKKSSGKIAGVSFSSVLPAGHELLSEGNEQNSGTVEKEEGYNILPGSSFYGVLKNPLYSEAVGHKAIIELESKKMPNCRVLGNFQVAANSSGLIITLNQLVCKDGTVQPVNGVAVGINEMEPIFADQINRNLLPRLALVTMSAILKGISVPDVSEGEVSANLNTSGTVTVTTPKKNIIDVKAGVSESMDLIDGVLMEELATYKRTIRVNPQAMILIFY